MQKARVKVKVEAKSKVLEGLNEEQVKAVTHGDGPLLIVAGAGTGKTTVITRRIAYLIERGTKPEEILALAFGEKAAQEMAERVDQLLPYGYYNLQVSTFHAFGEQILREHGLEIGLPDFKVLDEVGQWLLVRNNLEKFDLDYYRPLGNPTRFIKALVTHFARSKDELITPEEYLEYAEKLKLTEDRAETGLNDQEAETRRIREVASAFHVYQRLLLESGAADFGDLINYCLQLFETRPKILNALRERFKYILIDEFQDTNFAQYELLKLLASPKNNLTVVGDDDQSIFKFRGASISNILHFQRDYPRSVFISLTRNYRSGQKILDAAYDFIRQNDPDRLEIRLNLQKKLVNSEDKGGEIVSLVSPNYVSEAKLTLEKVLELKDGNSELSWNDFAILARSNDTLDPFLAILEDNQIPHIYFANKGLYRKSIILDILAYFRLLDNYRESSALYRVANFPFFGITHGAIIELAHFARRKSLSLFEAFKQHTALEKVDENSKKGIGKLLSFLESHAKLARERSAEQVFIEVVNDLDFAKLALEDFQNGKFLENFRRRIQDFQVQSPDKSLKAFMRELEFELQAGGQGELEFDPEAGPEAIKLMTVHGAKGLEFRYVFVAGLVDKRFPTIERKEPIEIPKELIRDILPLGDIHLEEERRLFYVAMTRTKKALYLSRALDYGGKLTKRPSRFLHELGLAEKEQTKSTGKVFFKTRTKPKRQGLPLPKSFSFSQISSFRKCSLEYKYRYILKLPEPGKASLSFGQTIHGTLEKFLKLYGQQTPLDLFGSIKPAALPDFPTLKNLYESSWVDDWFESRSQMEDYRKRGLHILKLFYEECEGHLPQPKYVEQKFNLRSGEFSIRGKIDRADLKANGLLIVDYKTGPPRGIYKVDKEQLLLYQWAAQDFFKDQVADLQYWFLWDTLKKESFLGKPEELQKMRQELEETMERILEVTRNDSFAEFDARVSHECKFRTLGL